MTTIHEVKRSTVSAKMEHQYMKGSGVTNWAFWFRGEAESSPVTTSHQQDSTPADSRT